MQGIRNKNSDLKRYRQQNKSQPRCRDESLRKNLQFPDSKRSRSRSQVKSGLKSRKGKKSFGDTLTSFVPKRPEILRNNRQVSPFGLKQKLRKRSRSTKSRRK
jgi:hypothetical protein